MIAKIPELFQPPSPGNGVDRVLLKNLEDRNVEPDTGCVARQIAHLVEVRVSRLHVAEKKLMKEMPDFEKGSEPSREQLQAALEASGRGVEALFTRLVERGELVRGRGPLVLLAYFISHESHHRGSILLALKQYGFTLPESLRWGIWGKWAARQA